MPFEIVRNDITNMRVDAIVNTANPLPVIGAGVDSMIHEKAGPKLLEARQKIGNIAVGTAAITDAFDLSSKFVIHTVGPVWRGGFLGESMLLRSCYDSALILALENGCRSIAFPLIAANNYGFPKDKRWTYSHTPKPVSETDHNSCEADLPLHSCRRPTPGLRYE